MKKILAFLLVVIMAACMFAACDQSETIVVGYTVYKPMNYTDDNGNFVGFDTDLAKAVFEEKLGCKVIFKEIDWNQKYQELNSGTIDCIWNGFTMQGREEGYTWTPAYVDNSQVVLVAADSAITNLASLSGKVVAVQNDTPVQKAFSKGGDKEALGATFKTLTVTATYNNAVMELESGAVDAVALDIGVAKQKMADKPGKFKMLQEIVMTETYGIGFKKGNEVLRDTVWATYKEMLADGTVDKIAAEYKIDGVIR